MPRSFFAFVYSQIELVYNPLKQIIKQKCKLWAQNVRLVNENSIVMVSISNAVMSVCFALPPNVKII